jgi:hypothetical protein
MFHIIGVDPPNPQAVRFGTNIPKQFQKKNFIPNLHIHKVETTLSFWSTHLFPRDWALPTNGGPTCPQKGSTNSINFPQNSFRQQKTLKPERGCGIQNTLDKLQTTGITQQSSTPMGYSMHKFINDRQVMI